MTNKQRRSLRRERERERRRHRAIRQTVAVHMNSVRSGAYAGAREEQDRFVVDLSRTWYVVRTLPRWASRAADQIRQSGTPVFEAREAIRLVSDIGKQRLALIPILRRMIFVGVTDWQELRHVESHPGIRDDLTGFGRSGVVQMPGGGPMVIDARELQNFADSVTGWGGDVERARKLLFDVGDLVRVVDGPFEGYSGTVEATDSEESRVKVGIDIFGRTTNAEFDADQLEKV